MSKPVGSNRAQAAGRLTHAVGLGKSSYTYASRYLLAIVVALIMFGPSVCLAGESLAAAAPEASKTVLSWETGAGKSYLAPALEIPGFILLLNGYDRFAYPNEVEEGEKVYDTNPSIFWDHGVHGPWGSDQDNFFTNQFKHPHQESIYHGFARSDGLNYGESFSQIASDKGLAGEPVAAAAPEAPKPGLSWETGAGKSYLVPALEIPAFILILNGYDRFAYPNEVEGGKKVYDTNPSTFWDHVVHGPWGSDQDNFSTNQFKHPYQEYIYHGFARSAGQDYRESLSQIASSNGLAGEPIAAGAPEAPKPVLSWETGAGKSYLVPAIEIPGFILLLNGYDRFAYPNEVEGGGKVYNSNLSTFWDHVVHGPWGFDQDNFSMNQFMHPYQGSIYYGFARSAGLSFWESEAYTFAGSFLWETGGETTSPSVNDQIASGIAGSFLGEPLFRMASLVLEGDGGKPELWREICAAVISPPLGFNRLVFGDSFKSVFPSHNPATFWRLRLGATLSSDLNDQGESSPIRRGDATVDFSMAYGLPGKPGYGYTRPFDYFHFEFIAVDNSENPLEDLMIRGLLFGKKYEVGDSYRGIWGLYGGYDYISPQIFRVSTTAASLGTTFQWWLAQAVALQGSVLGGVGYGAAGTISGVGERNYHYGVAPQGLLGLRLIFGDRAMLDATGRAYYIGDQGSTEQGREYIDRLNVGFTVRVHGRHALGIQYIASSRDAYYPNKTDVHQTTATYSLVYTLLYDAGFGAVEWRDADRR